MWQRTWVRILVFKPRAGDAFQVGAALRAGGRRGQLDVFHAERVEQAGDLHLLLAGEEGVGELLPLAQGGFDDGETVKTHGAYSCTARNNPHLDK
jgi:hypothetical protein